MLKSCKQIQAVTSQQVAEAFGKRHDHVIRDIREVMAKCTESFTAPNFGLSDSAQILTQVPENFIESNFGCVEYTDSTGRSLDGVESDIDN